MIQNSRQMQDCFVDTLVEVWKQRYIFTLQNGILTDKGQFDRSIIKQKNTVFLITLTGSMF